MQRRDFVLGGCATALLASTAEADTGFYAGYSHQITGWRASYFTPREFASKGNGYLRVSKKMIAALDRVRAAVGHPIEIKSGYRDPVHNARVGGARFSRHLISGAVDINLRGLSAVERHRLMSHLMAEGFTSFGSYARSPDMLVADMRPQARIWRHGGGAHPQWFRNALSEWGWQRDHGPTRKPVCLYAQR